jgi:hypothetical protein
VQLTLAASAPSHADPHTATLLRFDGARNGKTFARQWEGIMTTEPLHYKLGVRSVRDSCRDVRRHNHDARTPPVAAK